ncbi:MAG: hypothetical protein ABI851_06335 [Saprospiraceae bacterium]
MGRIWDAITGNKKKREAEMREFAFNYGLSYNQKEEQSLVEQLSEFELFKIGMRKNITNLLSKKELMESNYLFDYYYTISTGKSSHTYTQTVKFLDSKNLGLPQFYLKPEGFFTKLFEWFGTKDIDFDEDINFSEMFHLNGEFESVIRTYFDSDVRKLCKNNKDFYIEGMNYYLIIYIKNKMLKEADLSAFHKLTELIVEILKIQSEKNKI